LKTEISIEEIENSFKTRIWIKKIGDPNPDGSIPIETTYEDLSPADIAELKALTKTQRRARFTKKTNPTIIDDGA